MNERGFTLIETLVALVVGGMLLGSISWVISGLVNDLKAAEQTQDPRAMLDAANLLENILSTARFENDGGQVLPRNAEKLAFEMRAPAALGRRGYIPANLAAVPTRSGKSLVLSLPGTDIPDTTLLDGAEDVDLSYQTDSDQLSSDPYIQQINVLVQWSADEDRQSLSFRPRINADGTCVFDPISQQCRS